MKIVQATPEDLPAMRAAAGADSHFLYFPTHKVIDDDGLICGYVSILATPVVNVWLDSKKVKALDSVRLLRQLDEDLKASGITQYVMPCASHSPFFSKMSRLGFQLVGATNHFLKTLTKA